MVLNPKAKGNLYEKEVAQFLQDIDPTSARNYGSGAGYKKSDVHNSLNLEVECKRVEKLNIFAAIEEAERHAAQAHTTPAIFFRRNRMENSYVAIPDWFFKDLLRKSREVKTIEKLDLREQKYSVQQMVIWAKKVLKHLDQSN